MTNGVYLVAALEDNHMGDLELAKRMVDAAAASGADAVKIPVRDVDACYTAEILDRPAPEWPEIGATFRDVLHRLELSREALSELRDYARGWIDFLVAPYDLGSLRTAEKLDPDGWQVDPPTLGDRVLIREIARRDGRLLVAAGMVTEEDLAILKEDMAGRAFELLHCVVAPGLPLESTALGFIPLLRERVGVPVGYLALEGRPEGAIAAVALGARTIEVPFTLERALRGPSHLSSLDREDLIRLAQVVRALEASLHVEPIRRILPIELESYVQLRKALVATRDLTAGTVLEADMLIPKAPSRGLSPRLLPRLVGRRLLYDVPAEKPVTFGDVEL